MLCKILKTVTEHRTDYFFFNLEDGAVVFTLLMKVYVSVGFPETRPRKPNPAGVNQQAIPPPGQRKPH